VQTRHRRIGELEAFVDRTIGLHQAGERADPILERIRQKIVDSAPGQ
jgi:hypothetical protein